MDLTKIKLNGTELMKPETFMPRGRICRRIYHLSG